MKHLNPEDPEFTAKALGENPEDHGDISNEYLEEFKDLQSFADQLKKTLHQESKVETLESERISQIKTPTPSKVLRYPAWLGGIAAIFIVSLILPKYIPEWNRMKQEKGSSQTTEFMIPPPPETEISEDVSKNKMRGSSVTTGDAQPHSEFKDEIKRESPKGIIETSTEENQSLRTKLDQKETISADKAYLSDPQPIALAVEKKQLAPMSNAQKPTKNRPIAKSSDAEAEVYELSPFAIVTDNKLGYNATQTLAGTRVQTNLDSLSIPTAPAICSLPIPEPTDHSSGFNREGYAAMTENPFKNPIDHALSTFSIDVDTASYSNVRRMINHGERPPPEAVRVEEFINYFSYEYSAPIDEHPFAVHLDTASAPWNEDHRIVRIALKGKELDFNDRADANLVFLVDVSGSMNHANKLPLVKKSLTYAIEKMSENDRIAIVVYAGASGLALPSTTANNQATIKHALNRLSAGGSTNGGAGIELAYKVAKEHFIANGINRVVLCTDGDFNVGVSNQGSLQRLIEEKAKSGVYFSAIGFGSGNYKDSTMELLSNKGNGNYAYIDSEKEARKVFVQNLLGTLYTIAKDVKIQVEFNPEQVNAYRLIGYENRIMAKEDFNDDKKDAGDIGAGHTVTALYEIVPVGVNMPTSEVDELRYQKSKTKLKDTHSQEMLTVKLRYKEPDGDTSKLLTRHLFDNETNMLSADSDFQFATGVAAFGMILRNSKSIGTYSIEDIKELLSGALEVDAGGYRSELIELLESFQRITEE